MNNLDKYKKVFMQVFAIEEEKLDESFNSEDIDDWDSVTQMSLISKLEDEFDIMFDTDDILEFDAYEGGKAILAKYGVILSE